MPAEQRDAQKTYINGKLAVSKTIEGASNDYVDHKYQYDHLSRLKTHRDPRIGDTATTYYSGATQVKVVTAPDGRTTTYDYDATSGRLIWTKDHSGKYSRTEVSYSGDDRWVHTWGDVPNPVKVKYDDLGRRVEMHTYKTGTWTGSAKPTGFTSAGDKTTWSWDGETGLLDSKTDAASRTHTFTYNDRGQLKQRTDAKSVATAYTYFESADASSDEFTGELKKIDYPTGTDVQYTYTRFGALKTVTDAAGARTFTYESDLQVDEEQLGDFYDHGSGADDLKLIYGYAATGVTGRLTDFDLKAGSVYLVQDGYGYEAVTGRLNRVTGHSQTFSLSYLANSHLIEEVESGSFERHLNRQTNSHRISSIENEWSQTDRVNFTYSYDTLGRVSSRVMTGTVVDAYGSNTTELRDTYTYNDRHELTAAKTESKISGTYQELVGRKHAFTYDEQGNRKTHSRNSHTTTYTTNNLNQYTARTNHGFLLVEGTSSNAAVKVYETGSTEVAATRKNDYYFRDWDPDTTSTASDYPEINVKEGTAVTSTGKAWIPAVRESPTYDANGNLTADALWSYTYDEENRLIQMAETSAAATAGFPDTTITFKYDYLGRRVEKKVVRGTTTQTHLRFVWRGWMLVAELNAASNNARVKTYTWGPDISGSFGGAGGNGGVLIFKDHTSTVNESFYPAYDAQGNVTGLIDTSGNLDAAYEYDPFGKLIRHAGTRRASMSLLYGTKFTDMESGLIYYGHRYYDPRQGRFINRDPIGEEDGYNLYRFVGNNPVNAIDFLGLCGSRPTRPRGYHFDRRDDDEVDRYEKALERWEDDLKEWRECRRDRRRKEAKPTQRNNGGSGELAGLSPLTRQGGPLAALPTPVGQSYGGPTEGYTLFFGLGANAAAALGFDGNIDVAISFGYELRDWDIGLIKSVASQAGVNTGQDVHIGGIGGSVQDQEGSYLFAAISAISPVGFTAGVIDNQQSSFDHYRNENAGNIPLLSMDPNGWFFGITTSPLIMGAGTGYGEAEVVSLQGVIQTVRAWYFSDDDDEEEEEE